MKRNFRPNFFSTEMVIRLPIQIRILTIYTIYTYIFHLQKGKIASPQAPCVVMTIDPEYTTHAASGIRGFRSKM